MSFIAASSSFTRFRIIEEIPADLWSEIPSKLKQFSFMDIDEIAQERGFGWTNFDDMLDTAWRFSPPAKASYYAFSLRLDTRRIPPAVIKKHVRLAVMEEENRVREQGKKFVAKARKKELAEQVKLRLLARFLPIPAEFQVIWAERMIYFAATQQKVLDLFTEHFVTTFNLHLEQLTPCGLALSLLGEDAARRIDALEPTQFI